MPVGVGGLAKKKMSHISKTSLVANKTYCAVATFGVTRNPTVGSGFTALSYGSCTRLRIVADSVS